MFRHSNLINHTTQLSPSKIVPIFHPFQTTFMKGGHGRCRKPLLQWPCTKRTHPIQIFLFKMVRSTFKQRKINCNAKLNKISPVST